MDYCFFNNDDNKFNNRFKNLNKLENNNNDDIISLINPSIQINIHNHPLKLCYTIERKNFGTGWICNKCSLNFSYDTPSFYCTICDFDLCQKCLGEYRLNEIKIFDNDSNNFTAIQQFSGNNFPWQKKYFNHSHVLTFIKRKNNNFSWICDKCSKNFQNKDSSFYCSLCDFDICYNCFNQSNINNNIQNNNQLFFDNNKQSFLDNNKKSLFDTNRQSLSENKKQAPPDTNKQSLFDNNKQSLFDTNKQSLFDNNKQSLFDNNTKSLFNNNNCLGNNFQKNIF